MPRKLSENKNKAPERKSARLNRIGGSDGKTKTRRISKVQVVGERSSARIKERERIGGAGFALGLVAGGVGGWAVGRAMSSRQIQYVQALEARNRLLEAELARRG